MLEFAELSSVLGCPLRSLYPKSLPCANHEFLNVTFKPKGQELAALVDDQFELAIMWSSMNIAHPCTIQCPNHFVPLV